MTERPTEWHLDKSVPIGIIFTLALQLVGGVWFMAGLNAQVDELARTNELQDRRLYQVEQSSQAQAIATATMTSQIANMAETLDQIRNDQKSQIELLREILGARK